MPRLPKGFSLQASPIQAALSEGRTEDAKTLIVDILRAGKADEVVQRLAAEMIRSPKKRGKGRPRALPAHWYEIGEEFGWLRDAGILYDDAVVQLTTKYGYSDTHIRNCVRKFEEAKAAHDEATAEYYE
jgi:hypothetical protein